jgi:hypothetical protein
MNNVKKVRSLVQGKGVADRRKSYTDKEAKEKRVFNVRFSNIVTFRKEEIVNSDEYLEPLYQLEEKRHPIFPFIKLKHNH